MSEVEKKKLQQIIFYFYLKHEISSSYMLQSYSKNKQKKIAVSQL